MEETGLNLAPTPPSSIDDLLSAIPEGAVLIAPLVTSAGGSVYVLPHGTTSITSNHIVPLPEWTRQAVDERLEQWRSGHLAFKDRVEREEPHAWRDFEAIVAETLGWLWESLISHALKGLHKMTSAAADKTDIIVLATGGISQLPIQGAWDRTGNRYLIDDYAVSVVPSFHSLKICSQRANEPRRREGALLALFNDPDDATFDGSQAQDAGEASRMERLFKNYSLPTEIAVGEQATSAFLLQRASNCRFLHLFCHGKFDREEPERSGLWLAKGEVLDLRRIAGDLALTNCRLVSLAACETAISAGGALSAEQIGLPAAFLQAGAPAVVATLWPILGGVASMIIPRVYDLILERNLTPAQALSRAVVEFRERRLPEAFVEGLDEIEMEEDIDLERPFFWAAFVNIGY